MGSGSFVAAIAHMRPAFLYVTTTAVVMLVTYIVAVMRVDLRWRKNIKRHLPEVSADAIADRDKQIVTLNRELNIKTRELEDLKAREQAAMAFTHRTLQALSGDLRYDNEPSKYRSIFPKRGE